MLILFTVFFFSHGEDGDEIQWHSEHQQSAEATAAHCVVCGVRSLHRTQRTHEPRGGGGLEWLYIRQGTLASTSLISFK